MSDAVLDFSRRARTGTAEAVLCSHKSAAQVDGILAQARAAGQPMLLTRLDTALVDAVSAEHRSQLHYDAVSRTAIFGALPTMALRPGVGIVTAGTSDLAVAGEAARTLAFHGFDAPIFPDIGVAGLWRLQERLPELRRLRVIIAVAGMEGALFSVLAGLVAAPVIAVPSSVGSTSKGRTRQPSVPHSPAATRWCSRLVAGRTETNDASKPSTWRAH